MSIIGNPITGGGVDGGAGYCKMPDGTLICYGNSTDYPYNVASWGQLFMANFPDISFSVAFVSPPSVTLTVNDGSYSCMVMTAKPTTTKIEYIQLARGTAFAGGKTTIGWQAIGRWK